MRKNAALQSLRSRRLFDRQQRQQEAQDEMQRIEAKLKGIGDKQKRLVAEKRRIRERAAARGE